MNFRVQRRDLPVAPAAATAAVALAGVLTLAGMLPAIFMILLAALLVALLWRDRRLRVELVAQVAQDAAQSNLVTAASEQWYRALVRHSYDLTTVLAADGTIRFVSPSVRSLFGYDPTALAGRQLSTLLSDEDVIRVHEVLERALREPNVPLTFDAPLWHAEGRWVPTESAVTNLLADQHVNGIVLNTRDVSDRQQLQNQLVHQAYHDPLTGLANRALFRQKVEQALVAAGGQPDRLAVLFIDLDGFKAVNDVQGHAVGDELLKHVAARLMRCVRGDSCVARLGGDEFAVLLTGTAIGDSAVEVARRITGSLAAPVQVGGERAHVRSSTGIAVAAADDDAEALLRNADLAMYRAKAAREGGWVRYQPAMHDAVRERAELEQELRNAVAGRELALVYQPIRDLRDGRIVGAEALMRWYHPRRGVVPPDEFLALAEETGMMAGIGAWVLQEACAAAAEWQRALPPGQTFTVAVNVSGRQLDGGTVETVAEALRTTGLRPSNLVLEMTEKVLMSRTAEAVELLTRLKQLGVSIAVDDFGTGYSSLSYLSRYPVDLLKIDRSFTEQVTRRTPGAELARTIVQLGHSLGLRTVAEGVETAAQLAAVRDIGCDLAQGYFFAPPCAARGILELISGATTNDITVPYARDETVSV
jgi:diguanylate cyclase (GGDEF)-like protein/PAS domain S-box-containing protein